MKILHKFTLEIIPKIQIFPKEMDRDRFSAKFRDLWTQCAETHNKRDENPPFSASHKWNIFPSWKIRAILTCKRKKVENIKIFLVYLFLGLPLGWSAPKFFGAENFPAVLSWELLFEFQNRLEHFSPASKCDPSQWKKFVSPFWDAFQIMKNSIFILANLRLICKGCMETFHCVKVDDPSPRWDAS